MVGTQEPDLVLIIRCQCSKNKPDKASSVDKLFSRRMTSVAHHFVRFFFFEAFGFPLCAFRFPGTALSRYLLA